ncbi:reductase [Salmonella enterica subsp. enterica]|nr:reductase [Salmonella enterica subsp. enterica]
MRFSDEGALVSIRDPFIEAAIQGLGQEADYTPSFVSENRETVVTPDSVCHDPQKIRDILTHHPLWDAYDSRCISCGRCTTGCPTCTCYSVFDVAYDEKSAARRTPSPVGKLHGAGL